MTYLRWGKQHAADVNKFKLCAFVSLLEDFTDWEGVFGNTILLNILELLWEAETLARPDSIFSQEADY